MKEKGVTSGWESCASHTINQLCRLLQCRVQDVMEYIDEE